MNDIKKMLPLLKTLGLSPDSLGPEKLKQITNLVKGIKRPQDISIEKSQKIMNILGISGPPQKKNLKNLLELNLMKNVHVIRVKNIKNVVERCKNNLQ